MIIMSPGVSVVAAGLVSGLCFIVINGFRRGRAAQAEKEAKKKQSHDNTRCVCCLKPFIVGRGVECGECGARACRKGCSRWDTPDNAWHCLFCHQRRLWLRRNEKWFETFGGLSADHDAAAHRFSTAKSQVFLAGADYAGLGPGVGLAAGGEEDAGDSVETIRDYIEKIVDGLVGDVDEIPIDRLYDHGAYDQLVANFRVPLAGALARLAVSLQLSVSNKPAADTPTMAHAALRDLVERAVEEAKKLPGLGGADAGRTTEPRDISEQTYEDLLATAILNKVIERYQNERVDGNSNSLPHSRSSTQRPKYITSEIEVGLDEGVEEGSSGLEPLSQDEYSSDCSAPPPKYSIGRQEPLSLTIEEHIEEVTTTYTSDEEERENVENNGLDFRNARRVPFPEFGMDIIDPSQESSEDTQDETTTPTHVDLVTPVESWEENWLFQKKKMQAQSEPVSMLVPNPSEDFRPLIGDREADDTSDLSDCSAQSDEEIEEELLEAINNVVPRTPESPRANKVSTLLKMEKNLSGESRIENTLVTIENVQENVEHAMSKDRSLLVKNPLADVQIKDSGAKGIREHEQATEHKEHVSESERSSKSEIKLGIEDMLVFHVKDKGALNLKQQSTRGNQFAEFIAKEKSFVRQGARDGEQNEYIDVKTSGSKASVSLQHDRPSIPSTNERLIGSAQIVDPKMNTNVKPDAKLLQLTRELKLIGNGTNAKVENGVKVPQAAGQLELSSHEVSGNLVKDVKLPQLTRELKLTSSGDSSNIEKEARAAVQVTRELTLSSPKVNVNVENNRLPELKGELNLNDNATNGKLENGNKTPEVTRDLKLSPDENKEAPKLPQLTRDLKEFVDESAVSLEVGVTLPQFTRDLKLSSNESEASKVEVDSRGPHLDIKPVLESVDKPVLRDDKSTEQEGVVSRGSDQLVNFNDDLHAKEVTKTFKPSPPGLEVGISETRIQSNLRSLDEKLVSIETRIDTKLNSLDRTVENHVKYSGEVLNSLDSISNNASEPHDGVVGAQVILLANGGQDSHTVRSEKHGFELQNEDGAQQESEYTEHYDIAIQRHLDSLKRPKSIPQISKVLDLSDDFDVDDIPPPIPSTPPPIARLRQCREASSFAEIEFDKPQAAERQRVEVDLSLATPPRPGTIAEREHKKWENAAPIENNPYSVENIQKRLWERQYSRALSSDISSGENSEAPKLDATSIQVVLGAGQPDVKRYGRDYYINDAKKSNGERVRRSAILNVGRRSSTLSQNSGSYDDDLEPQGQLKEQETVPVSNAVTEVKTKVATWQQNNIDSNSNVVTRDRKRVEATIYLGVAPDTVDGNEVTTRSRESSVLEMDNSWEGRTTEDLLENVRRNSKNEMNAKLNNHEDAISEARKTSFNENQKSIHRIDIKAYGFENEITRKSTSVTKITEKRVVNKLDLKSFGYDSETQRIQSTGHIDVKLNNEIESKPKIVKVKTKSNLTGHHVEYDRSKSSNNLVEYETSGNFVKTKSSEVLKDSKNLSEVYKEFGGMKSAKSMPNVAKIDRYSQNLVYSRKYSDDEEDIIISHFSTKRERLTEEEKLRREMIKASSTSQGLWKSENLLLEGEKTASNNFSSDEELEDVTLRSKSTELLTKREVFENQSEVTTSVVTANLDEELPMPSVRRLAQAFIKTPRENPTAPPRIPKTHGNVKRERPTTPEIHLIETPRQMHSLTARSISREFREGLRQIPNKLNSLPPTHVIVEQTTIVKNQSEIVSEVDGSTEDVAVIAPGKLKNNIKFWEQLQNRS